MAVRLYLEQHPNYSYESALDNTLYLFEVRWNDIGGFWVMDISTGAKSVVKGMRLTRSGNLLADIGSELKPSGQLILTSDSTDMEMGWDNVGEMVLAYV